MMKKLTFGVAVALALALVAASAYAKNYKVEELNTGTDGTFVFQPAYLHVHPGDTVTFEPTSPGHDSRSYLAPQGAHGWSGAIGKPITVTLKQQGVYLYECVPHHLFGMLGVIEVGKPVNEAAAEKAAVTMEKTQVMNKGRLDKLMAEVK